MAASEQYFTAAQLAGLPGVPGTVMGVLKMAARMHWEDRPRKGRGGGKEYPIDALPAETRAALAARMSGQVSGPSTNTSAGCSSPPHADGAVLFSSESEAARAGRHAAAKVRLSETIEHQAARNRRLNGLKSSLNQPENAQRRVDAKLAVLSAFERFHRASGLAVRVARPDFARRYNAGEISVDAWVRELLPELSDASLWRWHRQVRANGIASLAGAYGNRKGESIIDRQPELQEFAISMLVNYPHCTTAHLMHGIHARFNGHSSLEYPSERALQRWVTSWKRENRQTFTALTNPDAWKGRYMTAFGSQSDDIDRVNQRWELDSTPGDVMLTDGRHMVLGVIDIASRRGRLLITKTSKATAIATLLRHTLLDWGAPEEAKTDKGSDYKSNHITRVFRSLDIEHTLCPPFQPWHKPHIERFFRTFSHGLVELLPGFIGHNVAERQAIENRAAFSDRLMKRGGTLEVTMSSTEFAQFCDRWCEDVYLHAPNEGLKGKTPFEAISSSRDPVRTIEDPRALDVLLAEAPDGRTRVVQKKGIKIDEAWFIAPELGAHVGDVVLPLLDPLDLGRVYVYDLEEGFICIAECPERTGMDRREVGIKGRAMQTARRQEELRALKATARKVGTDEIVTEILVERAEAAGKLARLPGPAAPHASGGLTEASKAARGRRAPEPAPLSAEDAEGLRALEQELAQPAAPSTLRKVIAIDDPEVAYRRWCGLQARIERGEILAPDETAWHASYRGSDEWRAMEKLAEDFPEMKQA